MLKSSGDLPAPAASSAALPTDDAGPATTSLASEVVIELKVRNHAGALSHVAGLFARRGFNLEAVVCVPIGGGDSSRMLLLVRAEPRLDQLERQLGKLYDVQDVRHRPDCAAISSARWDRSKRKAPRGLAGAALAVR